MPMRECWQEHSKIFCSATHTLTSQPACGQIAEQATTPSAARSWVTPTSVDGG